ncbi:putative transcriptional regulatory protein [Colletotrichum siamense]|nr:putative transcriptional regulatory protein [Colletotrichum siamense]
MDETSTTPFPRVRRASDAPEDGRAPKRLKDDPIRPRVNRACDRCKSRKTRCSGTWPCVFCAHLKLDCQFTATYRRGQLLPAVDNETAGSDYSRDLGRSPSTSEQRNGGDGSNHQDSISNRSRVQFHSQTTALSGSALDLSPSGIRAAEPLDVLNTQSQELHRHQTYTRNSPEPSQTDEQGHYVGPASGVSFLLRIQRKLQVQSPGYFNSSVFNFGDRPLPGHDSSFAILPPKTIAESMVKRYFDFAATTHRFLHRPSVESWLEELYDTHGAMLYKESARSRTAILFMVFAHSNNYRSRLSVDGKDSTCESTEVSARFFAVAEHQLSMEKGEISLAHVQARLAQCFYLLAQSRLNHCWTLFGITAHLAMALGIHRKSRLDGKSTDRANHIDLECRKRTLWCAYNLNTYLSAALGRPMTFHDEDIDQELPLCIDDEQLLFGLSSKPIVCGPSVTSGSVAQIRLSRILAKLLRAFYGIRSPSTEEHFALAEKFSKELSEWRDRISYLLDAGGSSAIFVKLVLRQRDVLKLAYWHAQILVYRPFLLKTFSAVDTNDESFISTKQQQTQQNIKSCIDAAMSIAEHIDTIDSAGEFYSTLFFIPYYGFSAVVILYVYAIQQRAEAPEKYALCFQLASKCHSLYERNSAKGTLTQRYGVVLQELRLEVLRNNNYLASTSPIQAGGDYVPSEMMTARNSSMATENENVRVRSQFDDLHTRSNAATSQIENPTEDQLVNGNAGPVTSIDALNTGFFQISDWGQFDSLVTGGIGSLDAFVLGEPNEVWENINTSDFNT